MHSIEDVREIEKNLYKAIVIMGEEAKWISSLERTTIEKPIYKAIEHFLEGKINYTTPKKGE